MAMSLCLRQTKEDGLAQRFILLAGYESGHACVYSVSSSTWSTIYSVKSHIQPVLSIAIHPSQESFYSTSADANLVRHPVADAPQPIQSVNTKHAGQTSLAIRGDGRVLVAAGWDGSGRVYSSTTLKQVAVLKWHVGGLQAAQFGKSNRWIVLGGKDGKISLWDVFN
jgi:ASTRA-associated protein 1